ncbi:hypothetical protein BGW80DRAFT_675185 [Lactifluus volemus]|nr:hypothetical protein BGW80DRAFT_675185 [Lactifluus volemus]
MTRARVYPTRLLRCKISRNSCHHSCRRSHGPLLAFRCCSSKEARRWRRKPTMITIRSRRVLCRRNVSSRGCVSAWRPGKVSSWSRDVLQNSSSRRWCYHAGGVWTASWLPELLQAFLVAFVGLPSFVLPPIHFLIYWRTLTSLLVSLFLICTISPAPILPSPCPPRPVVFFGIFLLPN